MSLTYYNSNRIIHCKDTGEVVTGDKYLSSKHWKQKRVAAYNFFGGRCQRCGDYIPLQIANIHHRNYKRMGDEKMTDLTLYCKHCHACIHKGRSLDHIVNGNLHTLLHKFLTADERQEAFDLLVKHFNLDIDIIEKKKEGEVKKGIEKHLKKMVWEAQKEKQT